MFSFAFFSANFRSIFLSNVSFERAKKTEQDRVLFASRTSYLEIQKFQKPKMQYLGFRVFGKNWGARVFAPQILEAYLVENCFLYKMHSGLHCWKAGNMIKNVKYW